MTRLILALALALAVIAAFVLTGEYWAFKQYGLETDASVGNTLRVSLLTISTYLGIIGQVLVSRLKQTSTNKISIINELKETTASRDFWIAIVASPLVLIAAYSAIAQVTSELLVCSIGVQNGYFFHSGLSKHASTIA